MKNDRKMQTKNIFGDGDGYVILEIDGEKKLLKNGTWGEFVVTTDDEIVKIGKLKSSKSMGGTVLGLVEVGDDVEIFEKSHTLSVAADSITFDLPVGTIVPSVYVRFSKYDKGRRSASLTKKGRENLLG